MPSGRQLCFDLLAFCRGLTANPHPHPCPCSPRLKERAGDNAWAWTTKFKCVHGTQNGQPCCRSEVRERLRDGETRTTQHEGTEMGVAQREEFAQFHEKRNCDIERKDWPGQKSRTRLRRRSNVSCASHLNLFPPWACPCWFSLFLGRISGSRGQFVAPSREFGIAPLVA